MTRCHISIFATDITTCVRWVFSVIRRQLFNAENGGAAEFKRGLRLGADPERMPAAE